MSVNLRELMNAKPETQELARGLYSLVPAIQDFLEEKAAKAAESEPEPENEDSD